MKKWDYWQGTRTDELYTYASEWEWNLNPPPPECTCGTTITLGKEDQPQFHSYWCEIKIKWEKDNDKKE